ncbi:MAG: peptide chain release factor N(5)-glutamine methyltransferase [Candidatus Kapaibacteriota bacterium]
MATRPELERTWTILDIIRWGTDYFRTRSIDEPRLTIELLLCHVLSVGRVRLYADFDRPLSKDELARLRSCVQRRVHHEPLQYITGMAYFYGIELEVTPDVLIPRPETEILVDLVRAWIQQHPETTTALDLGTGSGCIPIALAHHHPTVTWTAVDVSAASLEVARRNAVRAHVESSIQWMRANVLEDPLPTADIVTMNPPYIPSHEVPDLPPHIREYEPHHALTDDGDGLTFYRRLADLLSAADDHDDHAGFDPKFLVMELGWKGAEPVSNLMSPFGTVAIHRDLQGTDRFVTVERTIV